MRYLRILIISFGVIFLFLGLYTGDKIYFMGLSVIISLIFYALITNVCV